MSKGKINSLNTTKLYMFAVAFFIINILASIVVDILFIIQDGRYTQFPFFTAVYTYSGQLLSAFFIIFSILLYQSKEVGRVIKVLFSLVIVVLLISDIKSFIFFVKDFHIVVPVMQLITIVVYLIQKVLLWLLLMDSRKKSGISILVCSVILSILYFYFTLVSIQDVLGSISSILDIVPVLWHLNDVFLQVGLILFVLTYIKFECSD